MYFVYVLQSIKSGDFYKGMTNNIERRIKQHLKGKSASTRTGLPLRIVHVEICLNRVEARQLEKLLKTGYGRE